MDTTLQAEASTAQQVAAVLSDAGIAPLDETGWIRATGSDSVRWLNGMLTNSIQALAPGQGCYNFALNSQGRIQGDVNAFAPTDDPDALLIETDRAQLPRLMAHLDNFIIMDDVELSDVTTARSGLLIAGAGAASVLQRLRLPTPEEPLAIQAGAWNSGAVSVIRSYGPLVPRFEVWANAQAIDSLVAVVSRDTTRLSKAALEHLRILEGTPRYGADIRDTEKAHDLAQETAPVGTQSRALHFSKGCYLGQEIVERIRSRGNVHRAFFGFELTGALPQPGVALQAEGRPVGELTSVAAIPLHGNTVQLALGYVRREALERKLPLEYPGGVAAPVALPYRPALPGSQI
jgi:aminomethyltransferase